MQKIFTGIVSITESALRTIRKYGGERHRDEQTVVVSGYTHVTQDAIGFTVYHFPDGEKITQGSESVWDPIAAALQKKAIG